ncbi:uncharacterized protein LOC121819698 isoform X2 [Ovis aries]|uniref:uncharacterized protein LOC121819698 isoform X2 n=1 Tax=Ovis aries TaxID=9940 RepID=UPI00295261E6|nr:uncharacterized protein LOC121819698 isoform X2 [Ovis aries]
MRPSTSAFLMPSPTKDFQPVLSLTSPMQTAENQPTITHETNVTGSLSHSCSTGCGTDTRYLDMHQQGSLYWNICYNLGNLFLGNNLELRCVIPLRDSHVQILKNAHVNHL